jgi:transglutaminase-like putative cysteine protease
MTLILMAIIQHNAREKRWRKHDVDFSRDLWSDILTAASGLALVLVIASAIAPTITIQKVTDFVQDLREDRDDEEAEKVAESLGLEQKPEPRDVKPLEQMQATGLPRSHLIGSGPELTRQIVLVIDTGELPPMQMQDDYLMPYTPPNYYWQSLAYNHYTGRGWQTTSTESIEYDAEETAIEASDYITHHRIVHQRVRIIADIGNIIHTAGRVVSLDQPYSIAWRQPLEVEDAFGGTIEEEDVNIYVADSLLSTAMARDLRDVEAEYEPWIEARYLQLPENLPARVLALARDLTAIEPTAYDRAVAIETYLRTTFPYTLEVPYPPVDQDMADYFLFDLQKGYCDYYATSMTVLARAAGLPARMVIGYITGQYDIQNARYIVTEADAHAWTEIYFPGYGWVKFEPTAGRPAIDRGTDEELDLLDLDDIDRGPTTTTPTRRPPIWPWILGGFGSVLGVFVVILGITGLDALWLRVRAPGKTIKIIHGRMQRYARRILVPSRPGDTAYEFNDAFSQRITNLAENRPERASLLLPAKDELTQLTELYIKQQYTAKPIERADQWDAIWIWWLVRWRLLLARLWRRARREYHPEQLS